MDDADKEFRRHLVSDLELSNPDKVLASRMNELVSGMAKANTLDAEVADIQLEYSARAAYTTMCASQPTSTIKTSERPWANTTGCSHNLGGGIV